MLPLIASNSVGRLSVFHSESDQNKNEMPSSWNLFRSDGGIELVPEICLLIAEQLVDDDPKAVRSLLLVSKVG